MYVACVLYLKQVYYIYLYHIYFLACEGKCPSSQNTNDKSCVGAMYQLLRPFVNGLPRHKLIPFSSLKLTLAWYRMPRATISFQTPGIIVITHWGLVKQICERKCTNIVSPDELSGSLSEPILTSWKLDTKNKLQNDATIIIPTVNSTLYLSFFLCQI